jgi:HPt (histidine-containing phosphotransfer) domain-containing protein
MVAAYVRRCQAALTDAEAALELGDHSFLRVYGHRLKGSGGGYGIPWLTEAGLRVETAARRGDAAELQTELAALEVYLGQIEVL